MEENKGEEKGLKTGVMDYLKEKKKS